MTKNKNIILVLILYTICFFSIWAAFELYFKGQIENIFESEYVAQFIKSGIIKNIVWTLPAFFLIGYFDSDMYIKRKEMFITKVNWLKYIPIFIALGVYVLLGSLLQNGKISVSDDFHGDSLIIILFVGLTEEIVFRGWLLNATLKIMKKWSAVILNAILFLLIHFPRWIDDGMLLTNIVNMGFVGIMILSIIFSLTFIKSKNIIVPIAIHMFYDLLCFLFV